MSLARRSSLMLACLALFGSVSSADPGVTFDDIAVDPASGLTYERVPSASWERARALQEQGLITLVDVLGSPDSPRGLPGVVIFDADGDGDQDLYVTNGPGASNGFFRNRSADGGGVRFVDDAPAAGVAAMDLDSLGACAGDLDNDGDSELLVLGAGMPNRLFENLGDGTFVRVSPNALEGVGYFSASCALGDVDGDGLLDVFLSNFFDPATRAPILTPDFSLSHPNQLYRNRGGLAFEDISTASGILDLHLVPAMPPGTGTVTWVSVLVDLDQDGDLDLLQADDQGGPAFAVNGGVDRGLLQLFENDGTGHFTNVTVAKGLASANGDWMGLAVGDLDRNGTLDVFATNLGNVSSLALFGPFWERSEQRDSRHFLQGADGVFVDQSPDGHLHNPFGWGTSAFDVENDGDLDVIYHGGFNLALTIVVTPAVLLEGDGRGGLTYDPWPFAGSTDHLRRNVRSMAIGDLDGNGFDDVVSVANFDIPESVPFTLLPPLGGAFDDQLYVVDHWAPADPTPPRLFQPHVWRGYEFPNGSLSVELNQGESGLSSVQVRLVGATGVVPDARASRDPFGAVVTVTPEGGEPVARPLLGGSSMAAQDSALLTFGLGSASEARVDVLWPGGNRNRFFLRAGDTVTLPEIPCAFDAEPRLGRYMSCVQRALGDLQRGGLITAADRGELTTQARRAWASAH